MRTSVFFQMIGAVVLGVGLTACERVEFPVEESEEGMKEENVDSENPEDGNSGFVYPGSIAELQQQWTSYSGRYCWIEGYVVGYTERTMKNATFTAEGAVASNILLADVPWETDADNCLPVELNSDKKKADLSLAFYPDGLGQMLAVHGEMALYFSVPGVRKIDEYYWVEDAELPEEPDDSEKPESPEEPDIPESPEEPEDSENSDESDGADEPNIPDFPIYRVGDYSLQPVSRSGQLMVGAFYCMGTIPQIEPGAFLAEPSSLSGSSNYRKSWPITWEGKIASGVEEGLPSLFELELTEEGYRFRDCTLGNYLAYDVRGSSSSTSWIGLYSLSEDLLDERWLAVFDVDFTTEGAEIVTAKPVRYSSVSSKNCFLRWNLYGSSSLFKLNYQDGGNKVILYRLIESAE